MHCGKKWTDEWSCMCNDKCPVCGGEIEPYKSEELNDPANLEDEFTYHVDADWTPEGGWPEGCSSRED
jgi:hypothetical protein